MIFQQPTSSLNPVHQVGGQIAEVYEIHRDVADKVGKQKAVTMLAKVGIPDPGEAAPASIPTRCRVGWHRG